MGLFDKRKSKKAQMTNKEFDAFLAKCFQELKNKQDALMGKYNLGKFDSFWFDQIAETIQFKDNENVELEFHVVPVGSWSSKSNSWMWAWANKSLTDELGSKAMKIKELASYTGYNTFEKEAFEADEAMAHELTSMAVHHLNALGMYIVPSDNLKCKFPK